MAAGLSEGLHFTMIHPRLFHRFSFFLHPSKKKGFISANGLPRDSIGHYTRLGQRISNLDILARDAQRMSCAFVRAIKSYLLASLLAWGTWTAAPGTRHTEGGILRRRTLPRSDPTTDDKNSRVELAVGT